MTTTTATGNSPHDAQMPNVYDLGLFEGFARVGEANQELQKVAMACGLRTMRTTWKDFTAWDARGNRLAFSQSFSEASSPVSGVITSNKQLTRQFLETAGVSVPAGRTFGMTEADSAATYAGQLGYPVVVKPLDGKSGVGVTADIHDENTLRWAIDQVIALQGAKGKLIVEQHVPGEDYRIYVAYGEVLSVVLRTPAAVTGDGEHSVADLVEIKNKARRLNPHTRTRLIVCDDTAAFHLNQQEMTWETVPSVGKHVQLAAAANISRGGDSTEVLPDTHPSILHAAVQAVKAIPGLNQAGVDFLLSDHRVPLSEQGGGICEINTTPALMANQSPVYGPAQPVARKLIRQVAKASDVRITKPKQRITVGVRAQGVKDPLQLAQWVKTHAQRLELSGEVRHIGAAVLRVWLAGPTERVAALVSSMHTGNLSERPTWVKTAPARRELPFPFSEVTP